MLRRPPTNLNRQSEEATILLIREVLAKGIDLSEASTEIPQVLSFDSHSPKKNRYMSMLSEQRPHTNNTFHPSFLLSNLQ